MPIVTLSTVYLRMTGGLDEEEAAMNSSILDIPLTLSGEFFAEVCRVLIFDVLHDRIPAAARQHFHDYHTSKDQPSVVVDLVTITRCVDDIQSQADTILLDHCSWINLRAHSTSSQRTM